MALSDLIVRLDELEFLAFPQDDPVYSTKCVFEQTGVKSKDLTMNHSTLKAGKTLRGGSHPKECDEGYFVLKGRARLRLGGNPETGKGHTVYELYPGTAVFIPGRTFHELSNPYDEDFVLLTIWPRRPPEGANRVYDERRKLWGSDFRKKTPSADSTSRI